MITLRGKADLTKTKSGVLSYMRYARGFTLADSFQRTISDGSVVYTLVFGECLFFNFIQQGEELLIDLYTTLVCDDDHSIETQKEKFEMRIAEYLVQRGFAMTYEATIISPERARVFFGQMGCSHENMQRYPERYEEYLSLNITEGQEADWRRMYGYDKELESVMSKVSSLFKRNHRTGLEASLCENEDIEDSICKDAVDRDDNEDDKEKTDATVYGRTGQGRSQIALVKDAWQAYSSRDPLASPITSVSEAKKFYLAMEGSHSRMREEYPERYEEYKKSGVTKAHEDKWRRKLK